MDNKITRLVSRKKAREGKLNNKINGKKTVLSFLVVIIHDKRCVSLTFAYDMHFYSCTSFNFYVNVSQTAGLSVENL